ncbi:uncharacterized protein FTOL_13464 [Fusarium torulosum]|uniref:Uncharacterized protein n=1 Tax=Fusarium torulosum TaxID=33205 RepID=A0AAE8MPG7_9HYPO|nr:uncharacterized protein FTOL_13464 [Fusarium torulosum]
MPGYPPSISTLAGILMTKGRNTTTVAARSGFGSLGISLGLLAKMAFIAC